MVRASYFYLTSWRRFKGVFGLYQMCWSDHGQVSVIAFPESLLPAHRSWIDGRFGCPGWEIEPRTSIRRADDNRRLLRLRCHALESRKKTLKCSSKRNDKYRASIVNNNDVCLPSMLYVYYEIRAILRYHIHSTGELRRPT